MDTATIFWRKEFNRLISLSFRSEIPWKRNRSHPSTMSSSSLPKFCHWLEITPQLFERILRCMLPKRALKTSPKLRFSMALKINNNDDWDQVPCLPEMFPHVQVRLLEFLNFRVCHFHWLSFFWPRCGMDFGQGNPPRNPKAQSWRYNLLHLKSWPGVFGSHDHGPGFDAQAKMVSNYTLILDLRIFGGCKKFQRKMFLNGGFHGDLPW